MVFNTEMQISDKFFAILFQAYIITHSRHIVLSFSPFLPLDKVPNSC